MSAPDGCEGVPVNFGDQSTSQFGTINSWDWNFGNGGTSTNQNPSYTYDNPGTYTVTLIVENDLGCIDTIKETIIINPSPTTEVSPNDTTICYLDFVNLFASGAGTFLWEPNYNLSNPNVNNPVAGPDVTTTYVVTVTNSFGCFAQDSITITVFDTIIADAGPDQVICPGESAQLNGSGGLNYSWSGGGLSNPNISNPIATPASTTTYTLTVSAGSCVGTDAVTVFVKPFPNIAAGEDKTICEGDSVEISASGGTEYDWIPTSTLTDPTIANPIAFPSSTTTYTVTATDSNSCNKLVVDDVTVFVIERPDLIITQDTSVVLGTGVEISAEYFGSDCQWVPTTGLADPNACTTFASPTEPTTYYVYFTYDGCVFVDSVHIGVRLDPIVVFPSAFSPDGDGQNDYFRPVILGLATIESFRVYNRWGQVVFEFTGGAVASGTLPAHWGWDGGFKGKQQELGVYVYALIGTGTATGNPITLKGNVTLVR
jgi:gliding motility-associated-like protein